MNTNTKMPTVFTILILITIMFAILSWVIPAGKYIQVEGASNHQGTLVHMPLDRGRLFQIDLSKEESQKLREIYAQELVLHIQSVYPDLTTGDGLYLSVLKYLETGDTGIDHASLQIPRRQGLWNIVAAPIEGFFQAKEVALFILIIGGYMGILIKTGVLHGMIEKRIGKMKGREIYLIPIIMIPFSIGGTTYGMCEETLLFYPIIIAVFIAAGYDVMTGFGVILVSAGTGVLASTTNPFATGVASNILGLDLGEGLVLRFIMWVIFLGIGIGYVMSYAKKVKSDPEASITKNVELPKLITVEKNRVVSNRSRKWVMMLFVITWVVMILGVIPWSSKFGIHLFDMIYNQVGTAFQLLGFQSNTALSYALNRTMIITHSTALGDWYLGQLCVWFLFMAIVIGLVAGMKEKELVKTFMEGVKSLVSVALIVGVSRGIKIVIEAGGIDGTLLYVGETLLKDTNPLVFTGLAYLINIPLAFLIPSTSGLANTSMPIVGELAGHVFENANMLSEHGKALAITAYQTASGLVNMISPTSGTIMGAIALSGMSYGHLLKFMGKLLMLLFFGSLLLLGVGVFLPL
ncbi:MAG: YfcC family protein [Vallitaleaceae bacterium]|nr:YfcC family protein [Vallitaleaceae bacterium]